MLRVDRVMAGQQAGGTRGRATGRGETETSTRMSSQCRWLGAVCVHSHDFPAARPAQRALLDAYPALCLIVNVFDTRPLSSRREALVSDKLHPRAEITWVQGMKGLFWKRVLTPARLHGIEVLWLFDADVSPHPSVLPLGLLTSALLTANASALQPSVRAAGMGTNHKWLRQRPS